MDGMRRRASATAVLALLCLLVTGAAFIAPAFYDVLGGWPPYRFPWQPLSAPFLHGFSRASSIPHLAGNLFLLIFCGRRVEPILGSARFTALTAAAITAFAVVQSVTGVEGHGASVFIWAYAPVMAWLRRRDVKWQRGSPGPTPDGTAAVLVIMWVIVPVAMTAVPYSLGWAGNPVLAFVVANTFHLTATAVGLAAAVAASRFG